jgi:hypothetical protein
MRGSLDRERNVNKEKKSSRCDFERVLPQQDYTEGITKII